MVYDPVTGYWYAGFNLPLRDPSTTGGEVERGQYGIQLYRIPDASLLTGATPWELLTTVAPASRATNRISFLGSCAIRLAI
jgi:hypothetical protein